MKKRSREYILIIAITCMSWGFFFPEYTFTADSYRLLQEKASYEDESEDVRTAISEGRTRYRLRFAEYIRDLFS